MAEPDFNHKQPIAEAFGFLIGDMTPEAELHRSKVLCPFQKGSPRCTKVEVEDPLGVCTIFDGKRVVATCPTRFREEGILYQNAAEFFFPAGVSWTVLREIRLKGGDGRPAGNIDMVLVSHDAHGRITDFGALEVQAVYISGNMRNPFVHYMTNPKENASMDWRGQPKYPGPDFLSSSRKRLAPQLISKGEMINAWGKKIAVAMDVHFFATLPTTEEVPKEKADLAWFLYDFVPVEGRLKLMLQRIVYTNFAAALLKITRTIPADLGDFLRGLQTKLNEKKS